MKKQSLTTRIGLVITGTLLSMVLLFSACKKNNYDDSNSQQVSGLMAFNLVADKQGVSIALSGNVLPPGQLEFTGYTGAYVNIYPGSRTIQAYDVANLGTSITNSDFTFDLKKYYSLFVVGTNNVYRNVITLDNFDSLSATNGQAYVRYINAIPDSTTIPRVTLTVNGTNVSDANIPFGGISQFTQIAPGNLTIGITNEGNIQANRTITVDAKKAYTILLVGKPGDTDPAKQVQIRFVENGTLTP